MHADFTHTLQVRILRAARCVRFLKRGVLPQPPYRGIFLGPGITGPRDGQVGRMASLCVATSAKDARLAVHNFSVLRGGGQRSSQGGGLSRRNGAAPVDRGRRLRRPRSGPFLGRAWGPGLDMARGGHRGRGQRPDPRAVAHGCVAQRFGQRRGLAGRQEAARFTIVASCGAHAGRRGGGLVGAGIGVRVSGRSSLASGVV